MTRRAVLVGIVDYPAKPLRGSLNDVEDLASLLTTHFGVGTRDLAILTDAAATTKPIINALNAAVGASLPGDSLLFHFSGHGALYPDANGVVHSVLCPHGFDWSRGRLITDDDLRAVTSKIQAGVNMTFTADCCNSGDLARLLGLGITRYVPPPKEVIARIRAAKVNATRDLVGDHDACAFLSACSADEEAAETPPGPRDHGVLTASLLERLSSAAWRSASLADLASRLVGDVDEYGQHPQLKGEPRLWSAPFLG